MATKDYAEALLKDVILPHIVDLELTESVLLNRLKRTSRGIKGNNVESPTLISAEEGVSARIKGGAIHDAVPAEFLYATAGLKYNYFQIELYGQDRVLSEGNSNERVAAILTTKANSIGKTFAMDLDRQLWGDGTGVLTTCNAGGPSTDIVVASLQYIRLNMMVDVYDVSGTAYLAQDSQVTAIDYENSTITIEDSVTTEAGDQIYRAGNKDNEITGIAAMIADGNIYLGIDRTEHYKWQALCLDPSAALALTQFDELFGKLITERGANPSIAITDEETIRWIKYLYQAQGIPLNYMNIQLGYEAISYSHPKGRCPIIASNHCPIHTFWVLDERSVTLRQPQPTHWMPGYDGYLRIKEGFDIELATGRNYSELFNTNPQTSGKLSGYTTPIS